MMWRHCGWIALVLLVGGCREMAPSEKAGAPAPDEPAATMATSTDQEAKPQDESEANFRFEERTKTAGASAPPPGDFGAGEEGERLEHWHANNQPAGATGEGGAKGVQGGLAGGDLPSAKVELLDPLDTLTEIPAAFEQAAEPAEEESEEESKKEREVTGFQGVFEATAMPTKPSTGLEPIQQEPDRNEPARDADGDSGDSAGNIEGRGYIDTGGGVGLGSTTLRLDAGKYRTEMPEDAPEGKDDVTLAKPNAARGEDGNAEHGRLGTKGPVDERRSRIAKGEAKEAEDKKAEADESEKDKFKNKPKQGARKNALGWGDDGIDAVEPEPTRFLPRVFYFENTYVGGNAGYVESLRRLDEALADVGRPHALALTMAPPLDAPEDGGLAVEATLSRRWVDHAGRVVLAVGLRGSERYGWRRPPLDVAVVIDGASGGGEGEAAFEVATALVHQLGPQDHLMVVAAQPGQPRVMSALESPRGALPRLAGAFEGLRLDDAGTTEAEVALRVAAEALEARTDEASSVPGTRVIAFVTGSADPTRAAHLMRVAHELTTHGVFTSVMQVGGDAGAWWQVASAGYGNYHRLAKGGATEVVAAELEALSRVVARLIRVNVRLAQGVKAIRVLGSRMLEEEEVRQVKAREVATDRQLSRSLGIVADRGEDDDGIQTVIPYFYGGDTHSILIELWVEQPGPVAEVTVRYKDMVGLRNHSLRTAAALSSTPKPPGPLELAVHQSLRGAELGEAYFKASARLRRGDVQGALALLDAAPAPTDKDGLATAALRQLVRASMDGNQNRTTAAAALALAAQRKLGGGGSTSNVTGH